VGLYLQCSHCCDYACRVWVVSLWLLTEANGELEAQKQHERRKAYFAVRHMGRLSSIDFRFLREVTRDNAQTNGEG
jgi:hypothetical protein